MTGYQRKSRVFAAAAVAVAVLLALQLVVTTAVASRMEATNLLFGTADGQIICLSDHSQTDDPKPAKLVHKTTCDICAFAAQSGVAPAPQFAPLHGNVLHVAEMPLPRVLRKTSGRHEPRLTRGPPLLA